jgi:hypothetical protein
VEVDIVNQVAMGLMCVLFALEWHPAWACCCRCMHFVWDWEFLDFLAIGIRKRSCRSRSCDCPVFGPLANEGVKLHGLGAFPILIYVEGPTSACANTQKVMIILTKGPK